MEQYRRRARHRTPADLVPGASGQVLGVLRRLVPLDQAEPGVPRHPRHDGPAPQVADDGQRILDQADRIVSEAASILDAEAANGVIAARAVHGSQPRAHGDATGPLRQVHDLIDQLARLWPAAPEPAPGSARSPAAAADAALPVLTLASPVRPGQFGVFTMQLRNTEAGAVHLRPRATDLLGSAAGSIPAHALEFDPLEIRLEPDEQRELLGRIAVPADCPAGTFAGLLVVTGVDYLRALVLVHVA